MKHTVSSVSAASSATAVTSTAARVARRARATPAKGAVAPRTQNAALRLRYAVCIDYEVGPGGAEFCFMVEAARTARQTLVSESLTLGDAQGRQAQDATTGSRLLRVSAEPGLLPLRYEVTLELDHLRTPHAQLKGHAVAELPEAAWPYILPSRYCESDRLLAFAAREFGHLPGSAARARAICHWVRGAVQFRSGSTDGNTSAIDVMSGREGVCRDFAHLMIALCRASNIPARFVSGIDYGADPALGPQDFHAYVECWLGDAWHIFDPSDNAIPMGLVRIATGRDAADCAFATIFGNARMTQMTIDIQPVAGADGKLRRPVRVRQALSTDDGRPAPGRDDAVAAIKPQLRARAKPASAYRGGVVAVPVPAPTPAPTSLAVH